MSAYDTLCILINKCHSCTGSVRNEKSDVNAFLIEMSKRASKIYALCLDNEGCPASLEVRKLYEVIPDEEAEREGLIRVVD